MEENTDLLQEQVSDVYQKTLMSVPASVTSFFDNSDPELNVDSDFVTEFINTFKGSRLDNVTLRDASEESRLKVLQLFKEIERDLYRTRNSTVDISDYEGYLNILKMYLADRKVSDAVLNDAYYTVRNMAGRDPEAAAVVQKVKEKRDQIKAYMKSSRSGYKYTLDGIRNNFASNGILNKIKLDDGNEDYVIDRDAIIKRPTEVEELMNALYSFAQNKLDIDNESFNKDQIRKQFQQNNIDESTIDEYLSIIEECEYHHYSPSLGQILLEDYYKRAETILNKLGKNLK